jgi:hypothetical protein
MNLSAEGATHHEVYTPKRNALRVLEFLAKWVAAWMQHERYSDPILLSEEEDHMAFLLHLSQARENIIAFTSDEWIPLR